MRPTTRLALATIALVLGAVVVVYFERLPHSLSAVSSGATKHQLAPDFTLPTPDGRDLQLSSYRGKVVLLDFWATWCDPCREEFPDLVKVDSDYRNKGLNFIAISLDDITDIKTAVPKFLTEMKAEMPVVLLNVNDPEPAIKAVDAAWDGQLPATFLYDKDGHVVFRHFGRIKPEELRAAIDKAVSSKQ